MPIHFLFNIKQGCVDIQEGGFEYGQTEILLHSRGEGNSTPNCAKTILQDVLKAAFYLPFLFTHNCLDGGQHADQCHYDEKRTLFLRSKGYRVLRFWNDEIFKETEAVLNEILYNLNKDG